MSQEWFLRIDNIDYPATGIDQLVQWVGENRIQPSHYVYNPNIGQWMYAKDVEELKIYLNQRKQISLPQYGSHYCLACGSICNAKTIVKGSILIEIVLWLFMLLPGLIYSVWRLTTKTKGCNKCSSENIIPIKSPRAQELLRSLSQA